MSESHEASLTTDAHEPEPSPPPEIVREVAAQLKSLPKVVPYEEYAWIVHSLARLRWRCECAGSAADPHASEPDASVAT